MPRIAISYRRSDSASFAGRIRDHLAGHFGNDSIFIDIENIPVGVDFRRHIDGEMKNCDLVLAIIGPDWLSGGKTKERINNKSDPIRVEIETALFNRTPIIPVLLGDTRMPDADRLPESIRDFAYINAEKVDPGRDFRMHMERLLGDIENITLKPQVHLDHRFPAAGTSPEGRRSGATTSGTALIPEGPGSRNIGEIARRHWLAVVMIAAVPVTAALLIAINPAVLEIPTVWSTGSTKYTMAAAERENVALSTNSSVSAASSSSAQIENDVRTGSLTSNGRPSFPCRQGISIVEQTVCDNAALAEKDRMLNDLFLFLKGHAGPERGTKIADEHRNWRYARNQCREPDTIGCLRRAYDTRIEELKMRPSFDCSRSRNAAERGICSNFVLATKDQLLSEQYRSLIDRLSFAEKARVRDGQRKWLQVRDACGGNGLEECVGKAYDMRFAELVDEAR